MLPQPTNSIAITNTRLRTNVADQTRIVLALVRLLAATKETKK
jgi:hypothetical protein